MLCNALVCLAVWLRTARARSTDKILAIVPPIAAFVAAGFEHSRREHVLHPDAACFVKSDSGSFVGTPRHTGRPAGLTWGTFLVDNLMPVTIGNVSAARVMVGAVYWFVYLRRPAPGA